MNREKKKQRSRKKKKLRVRKRINGSQERPRLAVFRSSKHIYAQLINDDAGHTLVAVSPGEIKDQLNKGLTGNCSAAVRAGELLGDKALKAGIRKVVFDRRHYRFHGRIKALAEAARKKGLKF